MVTNSGNKVRETLLQVATEQYRQIGVDRDPAHRGVRGAERPRLKSKDPVYGDRGGHDYDAAILGWALGADPDAYGIWHSSQVTSPAEPDWLPERGRGPGRRGGPDLLRPGRADGGLQASSIPVERGPPYNFGFAANTLLFVNKKFQGVAPGLPERPEQLPLEHRAVVGQAVTAHPDPSSRSPHPFEGEDATCHPELREAKRRI